MKKRCSIAFVATLLASCTTATYAPPTPATVPSNQTVVGKGYDETWDALVAHASKTFFAIDNFERATGLMTLSFGASEPSRFVDCGTISITSPAINFNGPYIDYVTSYRDAKFQGHMNLLVQRIDDTSTRVTINTRYVINIPSTTYLQPGFFGPVAVTTPSNTFAFDSGGSDAESVTAAVEGAGTTRTCRATGLAESEILDAINS